MHKIQAVFFDLDGTLIDPATHAIPESSLDALHQLAKKGIRLFVSSGRNYEMVKSIPHLMEIPWSGFVCSNGQCIYDAQGHEIKSHNFSKQQIEELIAFCQKENMALMLVTPEYMLAPLGISDYTIEAHAFFHEPLPEVIKPYHDETVYMALIYNDRLYDFSRVEQIEGLRALPNQSTYADVVLKDVSKGTGVKLLCHQFGISLQETMAFGDSGNDIDMFRCVKHGIAMANGSDDIKAESTFITKAVNEDGITYALKHYDLI